MLSPISPEAVPVELPIVEIQSANIATDPSESAIAGPGGDSTRHCAPGSPSDLHYLYPTVSPPAELPGLGQGQQSVHESLDLKSSFVATERLPEDSLHSGSPQDGCGIDILATLSCFLNSHRIPCFPAAAGAPPIRHVVFNSETGFALEEAKSVSGQLLTTMDQYAPVVAPIAEFVLAWESRRIATPHLRRRQRVGLAKPPSRRRACRRRWVFSLSLLMSNSSDKARQLLSVRLPAESASDGHKRRGRLGSVLVGVEPPSSSSPSGLYASQTAYFLPVTSSKMRERGLVSLQVFIEQSEGPDTADGLLVSPIFDLPQFLTARASHLGTKDLECKCEPFPWFVSVVPTVSGSLGGTLPLRPVHPAMTFQSLKWSKYIAARKANPDYDLVSISCADLSARLPHSAFRVVRAMDPSLATPNPHLSFALVSCFGTYIIIDREGAVEEAVDDPTRPPCYFELLVIGDSGQEGKTPAAKKAHDAAPCYVLRESRSQGYLEATPDGLVNFASVMVGVWEVFHVRFSLML